MIERDDHLAAAEDIVGHSFLDQALLRLALTHSSVGPSNNEALATLGDRIYNVWVARRVYAILPGASKGSLTFRINELCSGDTQARVFFEHELHAHLLVGGAIMGSHASVTMKMASTALEALVAAVEVDGGREAAEAFLDRLLAASISKLA